MKDLITEFKEFVNRGNLVELAIAFILATAFAPVVLSIVDNIFMPIIAAIVGQPDFSSLGFDIGDARINYGTPLTLIVNFLQFAESSLDIMVYTFTKTVQWVHYHEVKQDVLLKIADIIVAHGAEIAFPTRTLHLEPGSEQPQTPA